MNDEKRFCTKCSWNDCDYGCTCPPNEEVYQCPMYMHYHPEEVKEFEKRMEEWMEHKADNIFEKLTAKEQNNLWMCTIFNENKIKAKTKQWTKEAEEAGMTLKEYLESISPFNHNTESEDKE